MARSPNVREVAPMPSSDDQSVDMPTNADPVRQREPDPIVAQLRERMERLPHGHPSSPYNDDGSRKPPLPDLSKYELPIPGDPDYRPEPSRAVEADRLETAQTSDHMTSGTNADGDPERTADSRRLWEVQRDVEPHTENRERLDQERARDPAPNEEDIPNARSQVPQEEGEASHDAPADDLDEQAASELRVSGDPHHQPEPSRASEVEEPTAGASEEAGDRQHEGERAAADEQPAPDSEAVRPSDSEDKPRSGPDGSWEWQGRFLTSEESRSADQTVARSVAAEGRDADGNYGEHGLTPAMRRIEAQLEHGELVPDNEEFALKGPDRFKLKLAERINLQPGEPTDVLASRIHDGIRYTFEYDNEDYALGTEETEAALSRSGYELITRQPSWDSP